MKNFIKVSINLSEPILTKTYLKTILSQFLFTHFNNNPDDNIAIIPMVQYENHKFRNLSKINIINKDFPPTFIFIIILFTFF